MNTVAKYVAIGILTVGIILLISVLTAWPIMLLWNWLMPVIFGLPVIGFWQAFGLMILANLLLKPNCGSSKSKDYTA